MVVLVGCGSLIGLSRKVYLWVRWLEVQVSLIRMFRQGLLSGWLEVMCIYGWLLVCFLMFRFSEEIVMLYFMFCWWNCFWLVSLVVSEFNLFLVVDSLIFVCSGCFRVDSMVNLLMLVVLVSMGVFSMVNVRIEVFRGNFLVVLGIVFFIRELMMVFKIILWFQWCKLNFCLKFVF